MQLENFRTFCDLVETKSFSRAAERNFISQSAVSQQIGQMELEFKCKLLDRKTRPFELTKAGQLFYNTCKKILDDYDKMLAGMNALQGSSLEKIKVTAIFSIGMHTLQPYIKTFMKKYPNINIKVEYSDATRIYDGIQQGEIDFGIIAVPRQDRNFEVFSFKPENLVLVCSPDSPLAKNKEINLHQLQMCEFVAFEKDLPSRKYIDDILARYNVSVHIAMEFDNVETIKRAIEINSGVSILPETTISHEKESGMLIPIKISNEELIRPTGVVIRKNKTLNEPCQYMLDLLIGKESLSSNVH